MSKQAPRFAMECSACGNRRELGCRLCASCVSSAKSARISERLRSDPEFKAKRNAYKILTRKRKAESLGRKDFVPHSMRPVLVDAKALLRDADRIIREVAKANRPAVLSSTERYAADPTYRAGAQARARSYYAETFEYQRNRVRLYKAENQERKLSWDETRQLRQASQADGTASHGAITQAKDAASNCYYCGIGFNGKRGKVTDHMVPLCRGGGHSMLNIVICCASCNLSKAQLTVEEWTLRKMAA